MTGQMRLIVRWLPLDHSLTLASYFSPDWPDLAALNAADGNMKKPQGDCILGLLLLVVLAGIEPAVNDMGKHY